MPTFLPDTNILIDFRRDTTVMPRIKKAQTNGAQFCSAPPVLIELARGLVRHGADTFESDKKVFEWLDGHRILELPHPFIAQTLGRETGSSWFTRRPLRSEAILECFR